MPRSRATVYGTWSSLSTSSACSVSPVEPHVRKLNTYHGMSWHVISYHSYHIISYHSYTDNVDSADHTARARRGAAAARGHVGCFCCCVWCASVFVVCVRYGFGDERREPSASASRCICVRGSAIASHKHIIPPDNVPPDVTPCLLSALSAFSCREKRKKRKSGAPRPDTRDDRAPCAARRSCRAAR